MNQSLITVRYAKALYQLAEEDMVQDAVKEDMVILTAIIQETEEFKEYLESPLLKSSQKMRILAEMFKGKLHELTYKFFELLINNKREAHLPGICRNYINHYKETKGIKEASLTTARPLSSQHIKEIHDYITRKFKVKIELSEKTDPSIIGGFVIRIEDQQINASIKAQLNKIKRELINS